MTEQMLGTRFQLWVDGVGGYLVCLSDEVVLGQAVPGTAVDIPILADISRQHATLRRVAGDYLIEPLHSTRVNGRSIRAPVVLADGDQIELAKSVKLRFGKPHALSASARLTFLTRHRIQPSADSMLLMADSCVLGPRRSSHVVCRDWSEDFILFRKDGQMYCRAAGPIEVDDRPCDESTPIQYNSRITGSDFALSLEGI